MTTKGNSLEGNIVNLTHKPTCTVFYGVLVEGSTFYSYFSDATIINKI